MLNTSLKRLCAWAVFVWALAICANAANYNSEINVTVVGEYGKIFVGLSDVAPDAGSYSAWMAKSQTTYAPGDHTYYLFASEIPAGYTAVWYNSVNQEIGRGNSIVCSAPSSASGNLITFITMKAELPSIVCGGVKYEAIAGTSNARVVVQSTSLSGAVAIPPVVSDQSGNQYNVVSIAPGAFGGCAGLTEVVITAPLVIEEGTKQTAYYDRNGYAITGSALFEGCTALRTVDMRACAFVETGGGMFIGCSALESVVMPDCLKKLTKYDFSQTGISSLDLSNTQLEEMGEGSFYQKNNSTSSLVIYVPKTLKAIGDYAFYNSNLEKITDLGPGANPNAAQIAGKPYLSASSNVSQLSNLSGLETIGKDVFKGLDNLKGIAIPNVEAIPASCFDGATGLQVVIYSDNLASMGDKAFNTLPTLNGMASAGLGAVVSSAPELSLTMGGEEYKAICYPQRLTGAIQNFASTGNSNITAIYLPAGATNIATTAFGTTKKGTPQVTDVYFYGKTLTLNSFPKECKPVLHTTSSSTLTSKNFGSVARDINCQLDFTAGQLTAICLAADAQQPADMEFYTLSHRIVKRGATAMLAFAKLDAGERLKAGEPYLCKPLNGGSVLFEYVYGSPIISEAKTGENGFYGTLKAVQGVATFAGGIFAEGQDCGRYGAYFVLDEIAEGTETQGYEIVNIGGPEDEPAAVYEYYAPILDAGGEPVKTMHTDGRLYPSVSVTAAIKSGAAQKPGMHRVPGVAIEPPLPASLNLYHGDVVIPEIVEIDGVDHLVTGIEPCAFAGQSEMRSVSLPATIQSVSTTTLALDLGGQQIEAPQASGLFYNCNSLESVDFSSNEKILDLGAAVFLGCSNLKEASLPASLEKISDFMFAECGSLRSAKLGPGIKVIGEKAFCGCASLATVESEAVEAPALAAGGAFDIHSTNSRIFLAVPPVCAQSYREAGYGIAFAIGEVVAQVDEPGTDKWAASNVAAQFDVLYGKVVAPSGYVIAGARIFNGGEMSQVDYASPVKQIDLPASVGKAQVLLDIDAQLWQNEPNIVVEALTGLTDRHPANFVANVDGQWQANAVTLVNGYDYANDKDVAVVGGAPNYRRAFAESLANTWQAFYLPFAMELPAGFRAARLKEVRISQSISIGYELVWEDVKTLEAHVPYVVKIGAVEGGVEQAFSAVDNLLKAAPAEDAKYSVTASDGAKFTISGTYRAMSNMRDKYGDKIYCLSGGDFYHPKATSVLNAFRIYMLIEPAPGQPMPSKIVNIIGGSEEPLTGIFDIEVDLPAGAAGDGQCYDLLGRKADNAQSGIVVSSGSKRLLRR